MRKINKKIKITFLIAVSLIIFIGAVYFAFAFNLSESDYYSYTIAVCEGKKCADFYVECDGDKIISNLQITGWITFSEDWKDPRLKNEKINLCG